MTNRECQERKKNDVTNDKKMRLKDVVQIKEEENLFFSQIL